MRKHLTYANVAATLALIIAVGGSSFAIAGKGGDKINGKKIKPGTIRTKQLAAGAVTSDKIADKAVQNANLADGSVSGAKLPIFIAAGPTGGGTTGASCGIGNTLVGGGAQANTGGQLVESAPLSPSAWRAQATGAPVTPYAICLPK